MGGWGGRGGGTLISIFFLFGLIGFVRIQVDVFGEDLFTLYVSFLSCPSVDVNEGIMHNMPDSNFNGPELQSKAILSIILSHFVLTFSIFAHWIRKSC